MPKKPVDWELVWKQFYTWRDKECENTACEECGYEGDEPDWELEQVAIERIVNAAIKKAR